MTDDDGYTYRFDTVEQPAARSADWLDETQELPAVQLQPAGRRRGSRFAIGVVLIICLAVVAAGAAVVYFVLTESNASEADVDDPIVSADPTPGAPDAGLSTGPAVEQLSAEDPALWQVVGTQNLYVRAGPGTQEAILGSIAGGGHRSTGERATVNGSEWKQIVFAEDGSTGWVSANFIAPVPGP